jgi:hypothetical protein
MVLDAKPENLIESVPKLPAKQPFSWLTVLLADAMASRKVQPMPLSKFELTVIVAPCAALCASPKPTMLARMARLNGVRLNVLFEADFFAGELTYFDFIIYSYLV